MDLRVHFKAVAVKLGTTSMQMHYTLSGSRFTAEPYSNRQSSNEEDI